MKHANMNHEAITGADYIAGFLSEKTPVVFEMIGGMTTHIIDAIYRRNDTRIVSLHHEQSASFAACGFALCSRSSGVAIATSGPGAVNLLTGIATCYFDSLPGVFITGQVNTSELRGERPTRQQGFQETDIVSMAKPITKGARLVTSSAMIPDAMEWAFRLASEGRPGPVLLDIPMDVQKSAVPNAMSGEMPPTPRAEPRRLIDIAQVHALLRKASRPLVLVGGGLRTSGSRSLFRSFIRKTAIPVVHSLHAVDVLPWGDPMRVGFVGTYGNRWANMALHYCDLLLVLGSRLDIRQTGANLECFERGKTVIHVDIDPGEIANRIQNCIGISMDVRDFLEAWYESYQGCDQQDAWREWDALIQTWKSEAPDETELIFPDTVIQPNRLMHQLTRSSPLAAVFVVDIGQHQMWAAQSAELSDEQMFLTSGGMGAMGFALPAAIGACEAFRSRPVVSISGDGGMQCNIQELETISRNRMPIKIVVVNNRTLGMVRQFQEENLGGRYPSTVLGYGFPDFVALAHAYGLPAERVVSPARLQNSLEQLWLNPMEPALLEVCVPMEANTFPKMSFGNGLDNMVPLRPMTDLEGCLPGAVRDDPQHGANDVIR